MSESTQPSRHLCNQRYYLLSLALAHGHLRIVELLLLLWLRVERWLLARNAEPPLNRTLVNLRRASAMPNSSNKGCNLQSLSDATHHPLCPVRSACCADCQQGCASCITPLTSRRHMRDLQRAAKFLYCYFLNALNLKLILTHQN